MGAVLGLSILFVRRFVPESPRWLMMHGRFDEADRTVNMIEGEVMKENHITSLPEPQGSILIRPGLMRSHQERDKTSKAA